MRKIILLAAAAVLIIPISQASAVTSGDALLTGGNFEGGLVLNTGPLTAGASNQYNKWIRNGWEIASGAQSGPTDDYARHGIGSGLKLVQAINAKELRIKSGRPMYVKFDYILSGSFNGATTNVQVVGLNSGQGIGEGSSILSQRLEGTDSWKTQRSNFIVNGDYDAIAVVFTYSSNDPNGFRGVDNIKLTAMPEPVTMLAFLMGTGMIGSYLKRRRL